MAEIIAAGSTAANSADFTLADGESVTISLTTATSDRQRVEVQIKQGSDYRTFAEISSNNDRGVGVLQAMGTFRVHRPAQAASFAVHLEQTP